jgi:hypothetical protein
LLHRVGSDVRRTRFTWSRRAHRFREGTIAPYCVGKDAQHIMQRLSNPFTKEDPVASALTEDLQAAFLAWYGDWEAHGVSVIRDIAYGGSLEKITRVKTIFLTGLPIELGSTDPTQWEVYSKFHVDQVDLSSILGVAQSCGHRLLVDQVGGEIRATC